MRLKLRFDTDDMKRFIIICVILLYIVAVAISNLSSITATGEFTGLNPFPAFGSDLILATLVFYIIALLALLVSCKSYFFEFDKGFGYTTEKKSDGYAKWCDAKDMKKQLNLVLPADQHSEHAGIALINDGKKIYVDDSEFHNLVIGSTGSGKTTAIIYPMIELLSKHGESMIITDPKGELYEKKSNMLRSKGYKIIILNFRDPGRGNAWNPLTLPYQLWKKGNQDKAIELLDDLALNILYDESNKNAAPSWEKTSADYFSGLSLSLFEDATEDQINLNSISLMTTVGEEKIGGSTYIKEYFNGKDPSGPAYINASSTILAPNDTKMSILAVFKQKIKLFASRVNLSEMLSYSDFSIEDIGKQRTAVFVVIQDEKKTYHSLVTILIKQIYETLIDVAQNNGGKLPIRTNFLLDEFANMPPLKDVTTMITAARSRQMRFTMIIQNFAQLNEVYGEQNAETIKGNCGNMIYLISTELRALEEISKMCGEIKVKTGKDDKEKEETRPLITISDLQKLKMNEVIIRRLRTAPFKTKLTPDYKMNWGRQYKMASLSDIKPREKREVKVFDVKEYVKEKKKAAASTSFGAFPGTSPFGASYPPPFPASPLDRPSPYQSPFPGLFDSKMNDTIPSPGSSQKLDVDKILKNLDEKIAEIEAEEKRLADEEKNANAAIVQETKKLDDLEKDKNNQTKQDDMENKDTSNTTFKESSNLDAPKNQFINTNTMNNNFSNSNNQIKPNNNFSNNNYPFTANNNINHNNSINNENQFTNSSNNNSFNTNNNRGNSDYNFNNNPFNTGNNNFNANNNRVDNNNFNSNSFNVNNNIINNSNNKSGINTNPINTPSTNVFNNNANINNNMFANTNPAIPSNLDSQKTKAPESFEDFLGSFSDDDFKVETPNRDFHVENNTPKNIDDLIDKIKEKSAETITDNVKPNMELKEENKYKEVSDDEFFDDFFDE